ncbi:alpha/beta fold hydrolase [Granulicella sp. WH15]|uniref:alpha/beta fold hydrolase n=1 Tax=Granulicella sp. WH15 TaxID=2602070 RepID=UPI001C7049D7|nr:alpha/beta fold hydrolase [Granulicella sp. WH15]
MHNDGRNAIETGVSPAATKLLAQISHANLPGTSSNYSMAGTGAGSNASKTQFGPRLGLAYRWKDKASKQQPDVRELIPALTDKFHLIAPDYIGFGHFEAPSRYEFQYTFDNLAAHLRGLLDQLGLTSYALYMQNYGRPVGFRLFAEKSEQVKGFIIQNANAYIEGVGELPKQVLSPLWENRNAKTEEPAKEFLSAASTMFN